MSDRCELHAGSAKPDILQIELLGRFTTKRQDKLKIESRPFHANLPYRKLTLLELQVRISGLPRNPIQFTFYLYVLHVTRKYVEQLFNTTTDKRA